MRCKVAFPYHTDPLPLLSFSCSNAGNLISHIFRENEICRDAEWERYFCYKSIEVPDSYTGPHLTFPMTFCGVSKLVEAFKHKQVGKYAHKVSSWQIPKADRETQVSNGCPFLQHSLYSYLFFFPSSSSMLDMFCSFLERLGDF